MNEETIREVVEELRPLLLGQPFGKLFQLSRSSFAVDFRLRQGRYLLLSAEPRSARIHLITRTLRELERASLSPTPFLLLLRKTLGNAILNDITKDEGDRIVRLDFHGRDETGSEHSHTLVAQLTGRSANFFLLDEAGRVLDTLRPARGEGQAAGELYRPPSANNEDGAVARTHAVAEEFPRSAGISISEALDEHYRREDEERAFEARTTALGTRIRQAVEKRRKLLNNLEQDLARHGDAESHKRTGDLLLANIATHERVGNRVRLTDYYADGTPTVELEIDEHRTLQEEAAERFARFAKAKRAATEVSARIEKVREELAELETLRADFERAIVARDAESLEKIEAAASEGRRAQPRSAADAKVQKKVSEAYKGLRRYRSSDGYEILVGRSSRDNDHLTFRVARSNDLWLHAADYPGSHVVVRNHRRGEALPHRTLVEAAQLAAHFSQAGGDAKVAVHHTERKFVSKVKGGAPGLVRLSSFRTIMVEPRADIERL